ncbi:copper amine oxidase N-terminal domain-containing protein [Paenibacillus sp. HWE-109]|uniref:stalk domain-containing protein n=1 Tax=Paenibacillus sp. HWE-109 TaxID=1306526 RepID=UPI001EDC9DD4|nr:stalk domain-containing protein [Paenibacillus sp. HWE-109]UKS30104.1 copper amine oxidase N-terminal domain-containing protein [Paenibacillus sp. HWE-109]
MRMTKWTKVAVLGTVMGTCFTAGVYAQDVLQRVDAYLRSDFNVVVDGRKVQLANPPLIYNNASYLPVKELGGFLGANVNWQDSTKTIYINPRINQQQPTEGNETNYTEIVLQSPYPQYLDYLGGTYPVLTIMSDQIYYRLKDIEQMGVPTAGLRKAKEKYTQEIYVSDEEMKKSWKEVPPPSYQYNDPIVITGEKDPLKLKTLREYVQSFRYYEVNKVSYYSTPIIIDALPELNTYSYLLNENRHFYRTTLKLTQTNGNNNDPFYVVGSYSKEDIEVTKVKN